MPFIKVTWYLKPMNEGKSTYAQVAIQADPGGVVPSWAANLVMKKVPFKTMKKLKVYLKKNKTDQKFLTKYAKFKDWK